MITLDKTKGLETQIHERSEKNPPDRVASVNNIHSGIMSAPTPQAVTQIHLQPHHTNDCSAYVPVLVGDHQTVAYVDSRTTFTYVISPDTTATLGISQDQLEPVPHIVQLIIAPLGPPQQLSIPQDRTSTESSQIITDAATLT